MTLGLTDGPNAHFRIAALVRVAIIPLFLISETFFERSVSPADLATVGPVMIAGVAYALITLVCAFSARRPLPLAPFASPTSSSWDSSATARAAPPPTCTSRSSSRRSWPRSSAARATARRWRRWRLAAYVTSSVLLSRRSASGDSARDVLVHGLDMVWRGGLAVGCRSS